MDKSGFPWFFVQMKELYDQLRHRLEEAGVRFTVQRLEMARLLLARHQHLTADQVFSLINESFPQASRATVFNNLKIFVEKGILRTLELKPGVTLYDSNIEPHNHAVDLESGEIVDLDLDSALHSKLRDHLLSEYERKTGRSLQGEELQVVIRGKAGRRASKAAFKRKSG